MKRAVCISLAVMLLMVIAVVWRTVEGSAQDTPARLADPLLPVYYDDAFSADNYFTSPAPQISADGKHVLFLPGAGWRLPPLATPTEKVLVYSRETGAITPTGVYGLRLTYPSAVWMPFDYPAQFDGGIRQAVYPAQSNPPSQLYLRDIQRGTEVLLKPESPLPEGTRAFAPVLSADGRVVAFASQAEHIRTNLEEALRPRINFMTLAGGQNESVAVPGAGADDRLAIHLKQYEDPYVAVFSDLHLNRDGHVLAFNALLGKDLPPDSPRTLLLYNRTTKSFAPVTITPQGKAVAANAVHPRISADDSAVAFASTSPALARGDTNAVSDVFVYDVKARRLNRVSVSSRGAQANKPASHPAISGDGRLVVFESAATNLAPVATRRGSDTAASEIFLHDRRTGQTTCVSEGSARIQRKLGLPYHTNTEPSISADGRYICYLTRLSDVPPHGNEKATGHDRCVTLAQAVQIYDCMTKQTDTVLLASNLPLTAQAAAVPGPDATPAGVSTIYCLNGRRLLFKPSDFSFGINVTDLHTGNKVGSFGLSDILQSTGGFAIAGPMVVAINHSSNTVAGFPLAEVVSAKDMLNTSKWQRMLGNITYTIAPLPGGRQVLVAEAAGWPQAYPMGETKPSSSLVDIDAQTGDIRWEQTLVPGDRTGKYLVLQGLLAAHGTIYAASQLTLNQDIEQPTRDWRYFFFALDAETGHIKWQYPTDGRLRVAGVAGDTVLLESDPRLHEDGTPLQLIALDAATGHPRWQHPARLLLLTRAWTRIYDPVTGRKELVDTNTGVAGEAK